MVERSIHINVLELKAAFLALQTFAARKTGIRVKLFLDNKTAVSYVNKEGGTRSAILCRIATEIALWCEARNISIEAVILAGTANEIADIESRSASDASDWRLDPGIAAKLFERWPADIDLFAARWNAQLPVFMSWTPQPGALG